jgi:uncharacterized damage-inducible protein DinB
MSIKQALINELKHEAQNTRKLLECVPEEHFAYKPHEKSTTLQRLATHIAEIPVWTARALTSEDFDAASLKPRLAANREELLHLHEETVKEAEAALNNALEEELMDMWTLRRGEHTIFSLPKAAVIRNISSNHLYHHRGQLTVYLRLLDVLVPGTYGPSADDALIMAKAAN